MAKTETPKTNVKINFGATDKIDLTQLEDGELIALTKDPNNTNKVLGTDNSGNIVLKTESGEPNAYLKSASVNGNTLTLTKKDNTTVSFSPTHEPSAFLKNASVSNNTLTLTKQDNTTVTFTAQGGGGGEEDTYTPSSGTKTIVGNLLANAYQLNIGTPFGARNVLSMSGGKLLLGSQYLTDYQIGAGNTKIEINSNQLTFTASNMGNYGVYTFPTTRTSATEHIASQEWVLKSPNTVRIHGANTKSSGKVSSYTIYFLDGTSTTKTTMAGGTDTWDTYQNVKKIDVNFNSGMDFSDGDEIRLNTLTPIYVPAGYYVLWQLTDILDYAAGVKIFPETYSSLTNITFGIINSTDIEIYFD